MLSFFQRRGLFREIRSDLIQLRRDNPELSREEFAEAATQFIKSEYEGINPDNLKMILDFVKEILPLILELFVVLLVFAVLSVATTKPATAMDIGDTVTQDDQAAFPVFGSESVIQDCASGECAVLPTANQLTATRSVVPIVQRSRLVDRIRSDPGLVARLVQRVRQKRAIRVWGRFTCRQ